MTPLRKPLPGALQMTSTFGYRTDPFLGRPALHSGVDLREDYGAPVRATAAGVVTAAGPQGGYGNLVEIDHGGGLATRYGHLSGINVVPGQQVGPGAVVGQVGSTGRSTGPHLHYEVRMDGEAVDPTRFLKAASALGGILQ
jgi:murein DD-endopeptidase MepM/ murein hydrolase activator NlpD